VKDVEPITRDLAGIWAQFAVMQVRETHPYLEKERRIPAEVLVHPRFTGKIYRDRYGNAVFPHYDRQGLCGFELRNYHFKGFAKGGQKGLWYSTSTPEDERLVITESAIEGLSYHALYGPEGSRYFSIAGEMNTMQRQLLEAAFLKLATSTVIVIAMNNDAGGRHLSEEIKGLVLATRRGDLTVMDKYPDGDGIDWNDVIKIGKRRER